MKYAVIFACLAVLGCSDDESSPSDDGTSSSGSGGQTSGGGGSGGGGGAGTGGRTCSEPVGDPSVPKPTPGDIQFEAVAALPKGEQLLFNDWNAFPNTLYSIRPDGNEELEVLRAYRIWSLGASSSGTTVAFACGDPLQEEHYGINIGDAIQHTWLYDVASQQASPLTWGNLNDECHLFGPGDAAIWICRRWDFTPEGDNKGYQIARVDADCGTAELPTTPADNELELYPHPTADESALYYTIVAIAGGMQSRQIVRKALPGGAPEVLREDANLEGLSPDGQRILFADYTDMGALYTMNLEGGDVVKVASHAGSSASYSADGTRIAYLWDETSTCHHVEVVAADGSQADNPTLVRDCGNDFITELAWITVP